MTINRVERGNVKFEPQQINLKQLCNEIIKDLRVVYNNGYNFVFNFAPTEEYFNLDSRLLKFIISNLLSNAFKYSINKGIVKLEVIKENDTLFVIVSDEGVGISDKDKDQIFEPFYRCKNSEAIPGTGLGLSIVKQSVVLHQAEIYIKSKVGLGTTFTVKIKL